MCVDKNIINDDVRLVKIHECSGIYKLLPVI